MATTIFVCDTCRYSVEEKVHDGKTGGERLAEHVEDIARGDADVTVERISCLMGCERHCNVSVAAPGKLTYVIGRFVPERDAAEAIVDYARLHAGAETGRVPFKQWPQGVKGHFVARIPAPGVPRA